MNLVNMDNAVRFYDDRYKSGYMDEWPIEKKQRVFEIIKKLNLPKKGNALDFGCGNGVFTAIIKQILPEWDVYGVDISTIAIENAKKRHADCLFFLSVDERFRAKRFDFLFTHHVMEHVRSVSETWNEINSYLKERAFILHILPCGNKGSLEYKICSLKKTGINKDMENKFFFEDVSHLRRLSTEQMERKAAKHGFKLKIDCYSNQFFGAINWITQENLSLVMEMTNPKGSIGLLAGFKLVCLRVMLLLIKSLRFTANTIDCKKKKMRGYEYYIFVLMFAIFYPLSKLTNIYLRRKSDLEWQNKKNKKNGSEMYLYYTRA